MLTAYLQFTSGHTVLSAWIQANPVYVADEYGLPYDRRGNISINCKSNANTNEQG